MLRHFCCLLKPLSILTCCALINACGISDYINSKKISNARLYKEAVKTTECDFTPRRIQRVENYINRFRKSEQVCGGKTYPAVTTVHWNSQLSMAAKTHSNDMANNNFLGHKGSRGLVPGDRVSNAGYIWKSVAENVAGGYISPEHTIEHWLASPGHCHNIMNPNHTEFALACTRNNISDYRIYWTLVLASAQKQ